MHNTDWIGMGGMWLFWLVIVGAIVLLARWLALRGSKREPEIDESPEGILKRRYARGDLSRQEYERRLRELRR